MCVFVCVFVCVYVSPPVVLALSECLSVCVCVSLSMCRCVYVSLLVSYVCACVCARATEDDDEGGVSERHDCARDAEAGEARHVVGRLPPVLCRRQSPSAAARAGPGLRQPPLPTAFVAWVRRRRVSGHRALGACVRPLWVASGRFRAGRAGGAVVTRRLDAKRGPGAGRAQGWIRAPPRAGPPLPARAPPLPANAPPRAWPALPARAPPRAPPPPGLCRGSTGRPTVTLPAAGPP